MPTFIKGVPTEGSQLSSSVIRSNFDALDRRTGKLTPKSTVPASTRINVGAGTIYLSNKTSVVFPSSQIDLGPASGENGISPFSQIGFFKDIILILKEVNNNGVKQVVLSFVEGPEKASSVFDPQAVVLGTQDLPIAGLTVRHNGIASTIVGAGGALADKYGQIEPVESSDIVDLRNYMDVGGETSSTTVGDSTTEIDSDGVNVLGSSRGSFNGSTEQAIKDAIENLKLDNGSYKGSILIKAGDYTIGSTIQVPEGVRICGEGSSTSLVAADDIDTIFSLSSDTQMKDMKITGRPSGTGAALISVLGNYNMLNNIIFDTAPVSGVSLSGNHNVVASCIFRGMPSASAISDIGTDNATVGNPKHEY